MGWDMEKENNYGMMDRFMRVTGKITQVFIFKWKITVINFFLANGKGRLIHADGDVYEGDWKEDKAYSYF